MIFIKNEAKPVDSAVAQEKFFCAGIGFSAGGFEALKELVSHLPAGSGNFTILLSQSLEDAQLNTLATTLATQQSFDICRPVNGEQLRAAKMYAPSPGEAMKIAAGVIQVYSDKQLPDTYPADTLFQSIAMYAGEASMVAVLSGTGTDGAAGVRSIKAAGGTVLVQMPQTAKYDGMPRAAINTSCADEILNPFDIGKAVACYAGVHAAKKLTNGNTQRSVETSSAVSGKQEAGVNQIASIISRLSSSIETQVKESLYACYHHSYIVIDADYIVKEIKGEENAFFKTGQASIPCKLWDILNEAMHAEVRMAVEKAISGGSLSRTNLEIIALENEVFFIRIVVKPVEVSSGKSSLFLVIFENLDPQKFVAKGVNITDKTMVGAAMQQLAGTMKAGL